MSLTVTAAKLAALALVAASATVSSTPVATTPYLVNSGTTPTTDMIRQCGTQMWAVGSFTSINSPKHTAVTRNNIFAFDMVSGAIAPVDPNVNGPVNTITFSPDCTSAYIGGAFTSAGGTAVTNIAKIDITRDLSGVPTSDVVDPVFAHTSTGKVSAVLDVGGHLLVGGYFKTINGSSGSAGSYLTSLDPTTGKSDGYANNLRVSGTLPKDTTHIYKMWANPAGDRVAIDGVFTSVLGAARRQAFILDLGPRVVSGEICAPGTTTQFCLDPWHAPVLDEACKSTVEQFYAKGLAWSPDPAGTFLYVASTGFRGATLCDSVAKFSSSPSPTQAPIWINKTGGDSLYSVAATATDVYIGGHERWANNPLGVNTCGTGCVSRPGIGDIGATSGLATPWDPTRSRGHGAGDLFLDSAGDLWISSDAPPGSKCGVGVGSFHPGICEFAHS